MVRNYIKTDLNDNVIDLELNILVYEQGDYFVAFCPSLNLSSYGDSIEDAKRGFDEVMEEYLIEAQQNNVLQADLLRLGWMMERREYPIPPRQVDINIPAGLLKSQYNQSYRVPATC